jgi:hypothetical protein
MRLIRRLAPLLVCAIALAAPATAPAATERASGSFIEGPAENERFLGVLGGAEVYALERDVTFTGTYEGTGRAHQTIAIREDGAAVLHLRIDFTGTVCGKPARLVFQAVGHGNLFEGRLSGAYAVLEKGRARGAGTFVGVPDTGGDYRGSHKCG